MLSRYRSLALRTLGLLALGWRSSSYLLSTLPQYCSTKQGLTFLLRPRTLSIPRSSFALTVARFSCDMGLSSNDLSRPLNTDYLAAQLSVHHNQRFLSLPERP